MLIKQIDKQGEEIYKAAWGQERKMELEVLNPQDIMIKGIKHALC